MTYKVEMTPRAKDDLRHLYKYIAIDLQSPKTAAGQLYRLEEYIDSLSEMSERFRVYDKEPWRSRNLRIMHVNNYLVFYIPNHTDKVVSIVRVMYGGRYVDNELK